MIPLFDRAGEGGMRGVDEQNGTLFSYVSLEERIPARHPLRKVAVIVNDALKALDGEFAQPYAPDGRPSIPPERLLRAALVQILFASTRGQTHIMSDALITAVAKAIHWEAHGADADRLWKHNDVVIAGKRQRQPSQHTKIGMQRNTGPMNSWRQLPRRSITRSAGEGPR
jgi:hypothetical protein